MALPCGTQFQPERVQPNESCGVVLVIRRSIRFHRRDFRQCPNLNYDFAYLPDAFIKNRTAGSNDGATLYPY
jgi:hypothetical protein